MKEIAQRTIYANNPMYFKIDLVQEELDAKLELDLAEVDLLVGLGKMNDEQAKARRAELVTTHERESAEMERTETDVVHFRLPRPALMERMTIVRANLFLEADEVEKKVRELCGLPAEEPTDRDARKKERFELIGAEDGKAVFSHQKVLKKVEYQWNAETKLVVLGMAYAIQAGDPDHKALREASNTLREAIQGAMIGAFWFHQTYALETPHAIKGRELERVFADTRAYGLEVYQELLYSFWKTEQIAFMYSGCARKYGEYFMGPSEKEVKREADFLPQTTAGEPSSTT